jgi:DNA helicase HerA-like ATPase
MTDETQGLLIAKSGQQDIFLLPNMANRHGLVAGATGTGKTVSLQVLAEALSRAGVPVFAADVKGDLSGVSQVGGQNPKVEERATALGTTPWEYWNAPVTFWDVFGEQGHPIRTTVSEVGPLLFSRFLNLNDVQEAVLNVAFRVADKNGLLLLDLKDLRAMLQYVGENADSLTLEYGNVSSASIGAIQRSLLQLEDQGGDRLFGEPALDLFDFIQTDPNGHGYVNLLAADKLMTVPRTYSTFLLWLLSELYERLPEAGDLPKPKIVFFFDEAHLLFDDAPKPLLDKIEQVVRLIRSKGVGVFFVTQNPIDIPYEVLGQLGNKVQHALRAFTPHDQEAVTAMAQTFRQNPAVDVATAVTQLVVGEALVSVLLGDGSPAPVERALMLPPHGRIGAITPQERQTVMAASLVAGHYEAAVDRESAYEVLKTRSEQAVAAAAQAQAAEEAQKQADAAAKVAQEQAAAAQKQADLQAKEAARQAAAAGAGGAAMGGLGSILIGGGRRDGLVEAFAKSATRAVGSSLGREIIRGVLGGMSGTRSRR